MMGNSPIGAMEKKNTVGNIERKNTAPISPGAMGRNRTGSFKSNLNLGLSPPRS